MKITGQSQKEKQFTDKLVEKNRNRERLPRGVFVESEMEK